MATIALILIYSRRLSAKGKLPWGSCTSLRLDILLIYTDMRMIMYIQSKLPLANSVLSLSFCLLSFFPFNMTIYMRKTPKVVSLGISGPLRAAWSPAPKMRLVCAGGIIPSSHSLAEPNVASLSRSILAFSSGSAGFPTASMTEESCSGPMTLVRAVGHVQRNRGEYALPLREERKSIRQQLLRTKSILIEKLKQRKSNMWPRTDRQKPAGQKKNCSGKAFFCNKTYHIP